MNLTTLKNITFQLFGEKVHFETSHYLQGDRITILIKNDDGEPFATLTVNIPESVLAENEVIIKNWSENKAVARVAYATGVFEDTGRTVSTGHVSAPIWKIKE